MLHSLREMLHSLRAAPGFAVALLITLAAAGFNGLMVGLMALQLDFLLPGPFARMAHFTEAIHRTHDLTFGFLFVPAVVGILAQLRRPAKNVAGMLMALIPAVALLLTALLTLVLSNDTRVLQPPWITVGAAAIIAMSLHPAGREFFRSFRLSRVNWPMLGLVLVVAVPLLAFAVTNLGLQGTVADAHAAPGHYGFMAAFAFTVIGVGVLASLRPDGWRLTAWVAGLLPALLGVSSLLYPAATSSLGPVWALLAIAWGVVFVAVAELSKHATVDADRPASPRSRRASGAMTAVVAVLALSACSAGGGDGVASAGGEGNAASPAATTVPSPPDPDAQALVFAGCMRDNGVDMPDPGPGQQGLGSAFQAVAGDYDRQTLQQAIAACQDLMPQYAQEQHTDDWMLQLADCLREQGLDVSDNPFTEMHAGDIDQSELTAAMEVCRDVLTGAGQ